jgi:hypothetical protein
MSGPPHVDGNWAEFPDSKRVKESSHILSRYYTGEDNNPSRQVRENYAAAKTRFAEVDAMRAGDVIREITGYGNLYAYEAHYNLTMLLRDYEHYWPCLITDTCQPLKEGE